MNAAHAWQEVILDVPQADVETCEDALLGAGALSVTLEELGDVPVLEPAPGEAPLWAEVRVVGLFEGDVNPADIVGQLHASLRPQLLGSFDHRYLDDQDWVARTQADFPVQQYGARTWVVPAWAEAPEPDAAIVRLDPGLAFGTGQHETTALCLEWLDTQAADGNLDDRTALDIGCGSGILALAALQLGAKTAWGTDIDPQALKASGDNAALNGIDEERLTLTLPEGLPADQTFDVLIANILANPLIELAPTLAHHLKAGGRFALSGVLTHQAETVAAAWAAQGLTIDTIDTKGNWALITGHRTLHAD